MNKFRYLYYTITLLLSFSIFLSAPSPAHALTPYSPFSVEGNPDNAYLLSDIFPLFRYIKPAALKIYENRDRSRDYQPLEVCPGDASDRRDPTCAYTGSTQTDGCDGGEVDVCFKGLKSGQKAYTAKSGSGTCTQLGIRKEDIEANTTVTGVCVYRQTPKINTELKSTDFSDENRSGPVDETVDESVNNSPSSQLTYPKLQNENLFYSNQGTANSITWGSHFLGLSQCDRGIKQVLVVERAKQTKNTLATTGEWPLGWVDWGYETLNGKTLLQIGNSLPSDVSEAAKIIIEATDDFFLNTGLISPMAAEKEIVCDALTTALAKSTPDTWAVDISQVPPYPPSFRQGYSRGSICVWDDCCPGLNCPIDRPSLDGTANGLFADISVSQTFGATLDDLLLNYSLEEGTKLFKKLAQSNPLIRFAGVSGPQAIPSVIHARLSKEITDPCFKYIPEPDDFGLGWLGFYMDYADPPTFLDGAKNCPGWALQPELTKEKGGAFPNTSLLSQIIALIWGGGQVDDVDPVKYHLLTIPDAMGQTLAEIREPIFEIRDTLAENKAQKIYNWTLSNTVDAVSEFLYAGKGLLVGDSKRRLAYFSCVDPDYSAPEPTGIEAYALGTRVGCYAEPAPEGKCDPALFAKILENTGGMPTTVSPEASSYFASNIQSRITPELLNVYGAASAVTGVPCEVFAAIHFMEANLDPQGSLISGRKLGTPEPDQGGVVFKTLLESAVRSGNVLMAKLGGSIDNVPRLITGLSRYNGGGNANCQLGYPFPIPYGGCPRLFEGEDDPYATAWLDSRYLSMYLLYCGDSTACDPLFFGRPGTYPVALEVYNQITKDGKIPESTATPTPTPTSQDPETPTSGGTAFFPETCGTDSLQTGLGCIPYTRAAFITALFSFIVGGAGAIALVIMLIAVFQIMTAASNAEQLQKGKQLFGAAVTGLLFLIFAVSLLRIIAGDIIKLPGF